MQQLLHDFANDSMVITIAVLVGLDLVLGVAAALKDPSQSFRLAYLTDFLRNDVLGKMIPYYAVWAAVNVGGDFEVAGIPAIEDGVGALVIAALAGSILNSLRDMDLWKAAPDEVAGPDPNTPEGSSNTVSPGK